MQSAAKSEGKAVQGAARAKLTNTFVAKLPVPAAGQTLYYDSIVRQFAVRVLPSGSKAYIVNVTHDGRLYRRTLCNIADMSADEARAEAQRVIGEIKAGVDRLEVERRAQEERAARARAEAEAEQIRVQTAEQTLRRLCELYVEDLKRRGRSAARDALSLFRTHVYAQPEADRPAREITRSDIAAILRRIIDKGHGRTAAKVRSYLRAAYQRALAAEGDATVHADLLAFRLEANPAANTASLAQFSRTRSRKLSDDELAEVLRRLAADDRLAARAAYLAVLLGGQRPAQLLRAKASDYDTQRRLLVLFDPKGRRQQPRRHIVPVLGPALPIVKALHATAADSKAGWLFSGDGRAPLRPETVNGAVVAISEALRTEARAAGAKEPEPFSARDLRAAVETQLAALGVSKEVRAQLLSHGLGGVQDRHYDRHEYLTEKSEALKLLHQRLAALMRRKRARRRRA
ncbi:MAG: integrase family protein [Pseudomonadota bacterium]